MFKKTFVSLTFSSKRVQILELNSQKNKLERIGFIDLPAGLVVNHKVGDQAKLAEIIRKAWKDLRIKEKSVGLVIPEFSTYTKTLELPKMDTKDIGEAVKWQSQEFLPTSREEMVMDWQIISQNQETVSVLVTALRNDILGGYINAVSAAGLYPLVVETPSLSLVRICDGSAEGRVIIYVSFDETIIVLTKGEGIVASSVASSNSENEIILTAARIIEHYQMVEVKTIFVGGINISPVFVENIKKTFQKETKMIEKKIEGIDPSKVQEYLVAISLQLKDPARPESAETINLLPLPWQKHYKNRIKTLQIWTLTLVLSFFVWSCFLAVLITLTLMSSQVKKLKEVEAKDGESQKEEVFQEVDDVNQLSEKIIKIKESFVPPQKLINIMASSKTPGISVSRYYVNLEQGIAEVDGKSSDRESLINFKRTLEEKDEFPVVELPATTLINEVDLDFAIKMKLVQIKKEVPKLGI